MNQAKKTIWITGASRGIGAALAQEYRDDDYAVCLTARSREPLEALASTQDNAKIYPANVTDATQLRETIDAIEREVGMIDCAILNAGTYAASPALDIDTKTARSLFELNVFSVIETLEYLIPRFVARRAGHIVIVGSVAGDVGLPYAAIYSASKSALNRICESLQPELAQHGVHISIVNPGFVKTPLTDNNDFPMPFIVSSEQAAKYIRRGIEKNKFEIRFPFAMSLSMRLLAWLPHGLFFQVTKRMLKPGN